MGGWPERTAFRTGGKPFCWGEVFLFACLQGSWVPFERRLRERTARLDGGGARELEEATTAFRHARGLLSADDTLAWLEAWGLDTVTWERVLHAGSDGNAARGDASTPKSPEVEPPESEMVATLWTEAVCSSAAVQFARALAGVAALAAENESATVDPAPGRACPGACPPLLRSWLGWSEREIVARSDALARLDALARGVLRSRCDAAAVAAIVERHRLAWVELAGLHVAFPKEEMAREARLRVRHDGEPLARVAAEVGAPAWALRCRLEELPSELQPAASAAQPGELVGPVATANGHALLAVTSRVAPDAADPAVRERAERALEERALARAVDDQVSWETPLREAFA